MSLETDDLSFSSDCLEHKKPRTRVGAWVTVLESENHYGE